MDFTTLMHSFKTEMFRLERLPQYLVEEEKDGIEYYFEHGILPEGLNQEWYSDVSKAVGKGGRSIQRLRLVSEDLTDYEKFEIAAYQGNLKAGEQISLAKRDSYPEAPDFWAFDESYISVMHYKDDGSFLKADIHQPSDEELEMIRFWKKVYKESAPIKQE